jgi:hypothetical protein
VCILNEKAAADYCDSDGHIDGILSIEGFTERGVWLPLLRSSKVEVVNDG